MLTTTMNSMLRGLACTALAGLMLIATATAARAQNAPDAEDLARRTAIETLERFRAEGRTAADLPRAATELPALSAKMAGFTCVPTCAENDAKFLALAGTGRFTLSDQALNLEIAVPAGTTSFQVGFFDGDGSRPTTTGTTRWDSGPQSVFRYTLFADPQADGTGLVVVPMGGQPFQLSTSMADAAWSDFMVDVLPVADPARAPSGNLFYRLRIEVEGIFNPLTLNVFKVRSTGLVSIRFGQQPFSYIGNFGTDFADIVTVFPSFPTLTPTSYDGTFSFFFDTPAPQETIEVFDGDFDFGTTDGITDRDTDDPNTPNTVPDFAPPGSTAVPEGVAVGLGLSTGNPPDDGNVEAFRRSPSVVFDVITPNLEIYTEDNPSGNLEWERFVISTSAADSPDAIAAALPAGAYEYRVRGVDLLNLNAIRLPFRLLCVDPLGDVCTPLRQFLVGDTVFADAGEDGNQDPGDPGIPNVIVNLEDGRGDFIATTTTDASGNYAFEVDAGDYIVEIDAANFAPGGALAGRTSTTGGESISGTVIDDNVLTFDFGYRGTGSIGDRVWDDLDGDGVQDAGEPGINGVTVDLLDAGGSVIATLVTAGDGTYTFGGLPAGDFTVRVVPPAGFDATFDADGVLDDETAVTLGAGENRTDVDFGYRRPAPLLGAIGDRVWNDLDADGVQDAGEPGINGVTVDLLDAGGSVIASAVTAGDGTYGFAGLVAGTYTVRVDTSSFSGLTPTFDLDGVADGQTTVNLGAGEVRSDVDFGYAGDPQCIPTLDFESDAGGTGLVRGQIIDDELAAFGITVTTGDPANHPAMIFDSANPTGGDRDLGTPNQDFGGPGIGAGGRAGQPGQNDRPLGKVLIISEDGDSSDPDDNAGGGKLIFRFDRPTRVDEVVILDIDEGMAGEIKGFDAGGAMLGMTAMSGILGDNSVQTVRVGLRDVRRLEISFPGSGAVAAIRFCVEQPVCRPKQVKDAFETASFANNDGADAWSGPWIEDDPEAGGAGPSAGQVRISGGFLRLDDYPDTGGEPSLAREVDLTGAASAVLRFAFDTSSGVDQDDAVSVEVSSNGGASWTVLEVFTGIQGQTSGSRSFDITAFAAKRTQVRFRVSSKYGGADEFFFVDHVEIVSTCNGAAGVFCPSAAINDPAVNGTAAHHAFWLPGISKDLVFSGARSFEELADGTARLTGTVVDRFNAGKSFTVAVDFSGLSLVAPPGSPKKELAASAYRQNGGPIDTDTWRYYTAYSGRLVGQGSWAAAELTLTRTGPAFQVGDGASGKNLRFGASSWFTWSVVRQPAGGGFPTTGTGDINIDLTPGACPPASSSCTPRTFRDDFSASSFANNDGSDPWSGAWIEVDGAGAGASSGNVKIAGGVLALDDNPDTGGTPGVRRQADLGGAVTATLRFDFDTSSGVDASDAVAVEVSKDGGATWTVLETFTGISGSAWGDRSFDITPFISSQTQVRFRVTDYYGGSDETFSVGFVEIVTTCSNGPAPKKALFVVGSTALNGGDSAAKSRLQQLGFTVTLASATAVSSADAQGRDLVVISSTVNSGDVGTKFRSTAVPVVTWESHLLDDLGMTGTSTDTDYGSRSDQTKLDVAGSGAVTFTTSPQVYSWGRPSAAALVAARIAGSSSKAAVFGYEAGTAMVGRTAPARRASLALNNDTPAHLTAAGWQLFDTVITWASGM